MDDFWPYMAIGGHSSCIPCRATPIDHKPPFINPKQPELISRTGLGYTGEVYERAPRSHQGPNSSSHRPWRTKNKPRQLTKGFSGFLTGKTTGEKTPAAKRNQTPPPWG